jgi:hypothetical protein
LVLVLLVLGAGAVGVYSARQGLNPLAALAVSFETEPLPSNPLLGAKLPYRVTVPPDGWRLLKETAARKEAPQMDRWLVKPRWDANVVIMGASVPGIENAPLAVLTKAVADAIQKDYTDIQIDADSELEWANGKARLLHLRGTAKGTDLFIRVGLFIQPGQMYLAVGGSPAKHMAEAEPEVLSIIESFEIEPGEGR